MKKRIFSLLLMAIIVTCFITGCSAKTPSTSTKSTKKVKNIGRMKSNVDVRRFTHDQNYGIEWDETPIECQCLDFKEYLIAYGATDIWGVDSLTGDFDGYDNCIICKFNNNIFVEFTFDASGSLGFDRPLMNKFYICAGKDGFHPTRRVNIEEGNANSNDLASSWVREQDLLEDDDDESDRYESDDGDKEVLKINGYRLSCSLSGGFSPRSFATKINSFMIPPNFDREFKRTIKPYLDIDEVSLKVDPFSTDSEIGGLSVNHDPIMYD